MEQTISLILMLAYISGLMIFILGKLTEIKDCLEKILNEEGREVRKNG